MSEHRAFMQEALALARSAGCGGEVPVGAVVVRDGEILGRGFNQPLTSHDPTAHAEMVAIREACKRLGNYRIPGAVLYATIEPCTMCAGALVHARIEHLVFGATELRSGAVASTAQVLANPSLNHRVKVTPGVMAAEAEALMREFFEARRHSRTE